MPEFLSPYMVNLRSVKKDWEDGTPVVGRRYRGKREDAFRQRLSVGGRCRLTWSVTMAASVRPKTAVT